MVNGLFVLSQEGTPQGGLLSPLLSNIMLNELEWELESRGLPLVRYADLTSTTNGYLNEEPPYAERHVRWCERTAVNHRFLLDSFFGQ